MGLGVDSVRAPEFARHIGLTHPPLRRPPAHHSLKYRCADTCHAGGSSANASLIAGQSHPASARFESGRVAHFSR
eukprot:536195-Pyramimonas_sp.AAC.1